jgi:hypothetical protein
MEYKITTEQILAMAKECPTAERILKVGFPDVFKAEDEWEDITENKDFVKLVCNEGKLGITVKDRGDGLWMQRVGPPWFVVLSPNKKWCWNNDGSIPFGDKFKYESGRIWRRK